MVLSPSIIFTWVGFFLINIGFVTLTIYYGSNESWVIGFIICFIYAVLLFISSIRLERRLKQDTESETSTTSVDFQLFVNLLYGLSVISLGASGLILSFTLFQCDSNRFNDTNRVEWVLNTSLIPDEVLPWIRNRAHDTPGYSFAYFPDSKVTIFSGHDGQSPNKLWQTGYSDKPVAIPGIFEADTFHSNNSTGTACFTARSDGSFTRKLYCTDDGITFQAGNQSQIEYPFDLYWNNDTLWVMSESPKYSQDFYVNHEFLIYSVDPDSMEVTLHNDEVIYELDISRDCDQKREIASIFLGALPVAVISIFLFIRKGIPTLPITAYVGCSTAVVFISFLAQPKNTGNPILKWWFSMSSMAWVLGIFFLFLTKRIKRETSVWGLSASSTVFFGSMIILIQIFGGSTNNDWWRWIIINIFVFLPLIFIGIVCQTTTSLVLGASGLFIDVWKIAFVISNSIPVYFGVFTVAGLILWFIGWKLNKYQEMIRDYTQLLASRYLASFMNKDSNVEVSVPTEETA